MAKLNKGILGPLTGKIGPIVAVTRNNSVFIRSMPRKSNRPLTPGQIAAQQIFTLAHAVLYPLKPFIKVGFKHFVFYKSAMDIAFPINYHQAISGVYPDLVVDYSQLVISEGRLQPLKEPVMALEAGNQIRLNWEVDWNNNSKIDDQVMLVLNCPALGVADGSVNIATRYLQECKFSIQSRMVGHEIHVYAGVLAANGKKASKSQYLGRVLPV